ncbi:MAG: hypothetical protein FJZ08_03980 [Candidatus Omnitrophica bacterium]|nr:hypothetical protein [Candidatus Omnitrophota bacterium]
MKRLLAIILITVILAPVNIPVLGAASLIPEFLCETGMKFYKQGRYEEALQSFLQALILEPDYKPALKYIQMLKLKGAVKEEDIAYPALQPAFIPGPNLGLENSDMTRLEKEMILERRSKKGLARSLPGELTLEGEALSMPTAVPSVIRLDQAFTQLSQPIEITQGMSIIISGKDIQRFLVIEPNILTVEQKNPDELLVKAANIGYTYVHVWDENDRWTIEFLCTLPEPEGPTYDEMLRREEEKARNFRLIYDLSWNSYESGRRIKSLRRSSYNWGHRLSLSGETPYGNINSEANVRSLATTTDLTYFNLALTNGNIGPFQGFALQGFDFSAPFSNLSFSGAGLRGAGLTSPAFNKKIHYNAFWGREGGGRYGNLSPGLNKIKNSFLNGFNAAYSPTKEQTYRASIVHGWGRNRDAYLPEYVYDTSADWGFKSWGLNYDAGFDTERVAYMAGMRFTRPKLNLTTQFRNIDKNYYSITGKGWRSGEIGSSINLNYQPTDKLSSSAMLDVFLDRAFPAADEDSRLNELFNWDNVYQINDSSSITANYNLQNRLGSISQSRYQTSGLTFSKSFYFLRDISTTLGYYHQRNQSFTSPASSYLNDKVTAALRFDLIGNLRYYINREMNWLKETYTGITSTPNAYETGIDWSDQLWTTPLYASFRMAFRDEEDTTSSLSFLSGEDYLEGYTELSYRPTPDREIYGSCRMRNSWVEKPGLGARIDFTFNAGMRYLWDTGVAWESSGNIEGYVFKDINSDGLRQRDEAPVEGVKIYLGKDKFQVTDIFGYYKFKKIKARKAFLTLDASSLQAGFVVTVPIAQEVAILHNRNVAVNFGIISRSEISGLVFEDVNDDGQYGRGDIGVQGVTLTLEDGTQTVTDSAGKYSFAHATVGEHIITLDLNTLPVYYLPQASLTKEITLYEGLSFIHNIPLKKIKEE